MNRREILDAIDVGFTHRHSVRFQEIDAAGIAYFPTIISYFHDAYAAFLEDSGADLPAMVDKGDFAAPIKHAEADFLRPIRFGEKLEIQLVGRRDGRSEVTIYYRILGSGENKAVGATVHVFVQRRTFERTEAPPELRQALERLPLLTVDASAEAHHGSSR